MESVSIIVARIVRVVLRHCDNGLQGWRESEAEGVDIDGDRCNLKERLHCGRWADVMMMMKGSEGGCWCGANCCRQGQFRLWNVVPFVVGDELGEQRKWQWVSLK
jgi:hypothetical protein